MSELAEVIEGDHSCFQLAGVIHPASDSDLANTLLATLDTSPPEPGILIIKTGSQFGPYGTVLRIVDEPSPAAAKWEDVVEASVTCGAAIGVGELIEGPSNWIQLHPGTYRLRVSALGRSESHARDRSYPEDAASVNADAEQPVEHYLVELWPAATADPVVVRESSQFARDVLDPPAPTYPPERSEGLAAAYRVAADLSLDPGGRRITGELCDIAVVAEVEMTPTQAFNRLRYTNGWPPSNGGGISLNERVGDRAYHYGDRPDPDAQRPLLGTIETVVTEFEKPKRFSLSWNWLIAGPGGDLGPNNSPLLESPSTVEMTFVKINDRGQAPRTLVTVRHLGVPAEWTADLPALWRWDIANFTSR